MSSAILFQGKSGLEIAEIADPYLEGLPLGGDTSAGQSEAQRLVDDRAERPTGAAQFRLELGRHIVVEGKRRWHILMLGLDMMMSIRVIHYPGAGETAQDTGGGVDRKLAQ